MFASRWSRAGAAALCLALAGCGEQWMASQPRYDTFEPSPFFEDGLSARPLVPGTVARGQLRADALVSAGRAPDPAVVADLVRSLDRAGIAPGASFTDAFPFEVTREVVRRGQQRFNIFCSVCHGYGGEGNGRVVERGYTRPPSFHEPRLREAPAGQLFDVITRGHGAMPSYAVELAPRDRWAVVAYVRALQFSQHASLDDVPGATRAEKLKLLEKGGRSP
jgi:mono/diheme cytochrome c family protein